MLEITKPSIKLPKTHKAKVLRTKEKIVNDIKLTGTWKATQIGLIRTCTIVKNIATSPAVKAVSIVEPLTKCANAPTASKIVNQ